MDDLDKYIEKRKNEDPDFTMDFEEFKTRVVLGLDGLN